MGTKETFYSQIAGISLQIEKATDGKLLAQTHMTQAANETGFYAGGVWRGIDGWDGVNNLTGISPDGVIANYDDLAAYGSAYVRVITGEGFGYPRVLEASASGTRAQMVALGASLWNGENHYAYGGQVGGKLLQIWSTDATIIEEAIKAQRELEAVRVKTEMEAQGQEAKESPLPETAVKEVLAAPETTKMDQALWYLAELKKILERIEGQEKASVQGA